MFGLYPDKEIENTLAIPDQLIDRIQEKTDIVEVISRYVPLKKLSTGQKCTAMIILALSEGDMPVIVDQPEDSLDIRAIWDDMCMKLRGEKEARQFIFTTHNSSVAVASDTDKFLIMSGTATKGELLFSGAIDTEPIREEVIRYLEGGIEPYKLKYHKYNIPRKLIDEK